MSCGVGCRCSSDPGLLWLRWRPAAVAPMGPLAWEPPYAPGAALKTKQQKKGVDIHVSSRISHHKKKNASFRFRLWWSRLPFSVKLRFPPLVRKSLSVSQLKKGLLLSRVARTLPTLPGPRCRMETRRGFLSPPFITFVFLGKSPGLGFELRSGILSLKGFRYRRSCFAICQTGTVGANRLI